jgi:hypothetical protein
VSSKANWGHPRPHPAPVSASSLPPAAAGPPVEEERLSLPEKAHTRCRLVAPLPCHPPSSLLPPPSPLTPCCSRLIAVPLVCGLTGVCSGLALICTGIACFSR